MRVLIVDDDAELRDLVGFALRGEGHETLAAADGLEALEVCRREGPDLVILDVNMPRLDGFETLRRLRAAGADVPVMMLTVRADEDDQVRGLDLGADDYLAKPFSVRALTARVRALGRRTGGAAVETWGAWTLDADALTARIADGEPARLTTLEFRLLQLLLSRRGRPIDSDELARRIWGYRGLGDRARLKQLVHRLRRKVEPDPAAASWIVMVQGVGYAARASAGAERAAGDGDGRC